MVMPATCSTVCLVRSLPSLAVGGLPSSALVRLLSVLCALHRLERLHGCLPRQHLFLQRLPLLRPGCCTPRHLFDLWSCAVPAFCQRCSAPPLSNLDVFLFPSWGAVLTPTSTPHSSLLSALLADHLDLPQLRCTSYFSQAAARKAQCREMVVCWCALVSPRLLGRPCAAPWLCRLFEELYYEFAASLGEAALLQLSITATLDGCQAGGGFAWCWCTH